MQEAMALIRAELGPDAVILSSKPVRREGFGGFFRKKELEVVAAYEPRLESPRAKEERDAALRRKAAPKEAAAVNTQELSQAIKKVAAQAQGISPAMARLPAAQAVAQYARASGKTEPQDTQEGEPFAPYHPPEMVIHEPGQPPEGTQPEIPQDSGERIERLDARLSALRGMVEDLVRSQQAPSVAPEDTPKPVRSLLDGLLENDVESELARELVRRAQEQALERGQPIDEALREQLARKLGEPSPLRFTPGRRTVVFFMGPTGVGKTTTLVKLATMCAVRGEQRVGLINTDTYRIAAQEQLRTYAEILNVPLRVMYTPGEVAAAIEEMNDCDVIFVDTAGKPPGDAQHLAEMTALLSGGGDWDSVVMLTVTASISYRAMRNLLEHYRFLDRYRIILTKTDETTGWGAALHATSLSGMPLAYITGGQSVPDDIAEADIPALAARLLQ